MFKSRALSTPGERVIEMLGNCRHSGRQRRNLTRSVRAEGRSAEGAVRRNQSVRPPEVDVPRSKSLIGRIFAMQIRCGSPENVPGAEDHMSVTTKSSISTAAVAALRRLDQPVERLPRAAAARAATPATAEATCDEFTCTKASKAPDVALPSRDSRYVRFVDAVRGLRLEPDPATPPSTQDQRAIDAARDIFQRDDGVPKEVRPDAGGTPPARADQ